MSDDERGRKPAMVLFIYLLLPPSLPLAFSLNLSPPSSSSPLPPSLAFSHSPMETSSEWLVVESTQPEEPEASRFISCGFDEVRQSTIC